jgi:hypothetical protein
MGSAEAAEANKCEKSASTLCLCVSRRDEIVTDATVSVQFEID